MNEIRSLFQHERMHRAQLLHSVKNISCTSIDASSINLFKNFRISFLHYHTIRQLMIPYWRHLQLTQDELRLSMFKMLKCGALKCLKCGADAGGRNDQPPIPSRNGGVALSRHWTRYFLKVSNPSRKVSHCHVCRYYHEHGDWVDRREFRTPATDPH